MTPQPESDIAQADDVIDWLSRNSETANIQAAICDLNGVLRGKRIPV